MSEFKRIFHGATGAEIAEIGDDRVQYGGSAKYISLGYNAFSESAGYAVLDDLGSDGYKIAKRGLSVFILGENYGTLYGVYGLMSDLFGYEYYYKDTETFEKRDRLSLSAVREKTDVPDFPLRAAGYGTMWAENDVLNPNRYGVKIYTDYLAPAGGAVLHNSFNYLPPSQYLSAHPGWYNASVDQLCYTAHGDAAEYSAMVDAAAAKMHEAIVANPHKEYIAFMGQDNHSACDCAQCAFYKNRYGADSAAYVLFVNDVNTAVRELLRDGGTVTDIKIVLGMYLGYYQPPVYNTQEIILSDDVCAWVAPIEIDYAREFSEQTKDIFRAWKALSPNIGFWLYDTIYGVSPSGADCVFVPFNSFNGMAERYEFLRSVGAQFIFCQGQSECYGLQSGFNNLKMYLNSELAWDADADVEKLTDGFFLNYYGIAAEQMREYFDSVTAHMLEMTRNGVGGTPYGGWANAEYWGKSDIIEWKNAVERALAALESLKDGNPALYDKYYRHVVAERIDLNYMLLEFHGKSLDDAETCKAQLKSDIIVTGMQVGMLKGEELYNALMQNL